MKHIDIAEFQKLGYLQEANRLFFHPHGLALEVTVVDEGGLRPDDPIIESIEAALDEVRPDVGNADFAKQLAAALYPVGSKFLSGVWDDRDDPEGVYFGDEKATKAAEPKRERLRHALARAKFFGRGVGSHTAATVVSTGMDIEPLGWVYEKPEASDEA